MKLDKYDELIIRTCKKCLSPEQTIRRLLRIWRWRCGLPIDYDRHACIVYLSQRMWEIIEGAELTTITKLIYQLDRRDEYYDYYDVHPNIKFIFGEAISVLRLSNPKKFENYRVPAYFRNNQKTS